jgi:hypothetical protein
VVYWVVALAQQSLGSASPAHVKPTQRRADEDDGVGLGFIGMVQWDLTVSSLHKGVIYVREPPENSLFA